jgi:hypothetical protein
MLKVEELIGLIALEALTKGVKQYVLWRKPYVLSKGSLSKVKQFMENNIRVEEVRLL